jgi:serine/threonine-protein kinase
MIRPRPAFVTLLASFAVLSILVAATYSMLPERVATHFSARGEPDGWMSRPAYIAFVLGGAVLTASSCAGPIYLIRFLDASAINIPNREYWLAPEHRAEADRRILAFGFWLAALTVGLFVGLHVLTILANRREPARLPMGEGLGLMAAFLLGVGFLVLGLCSWFWRVDEDEATTDGF